MTQTKSAPPLNPMLQSFRLEQMLDVLGRQHQLKAARRISGQKGVSSPDEAEQQIRLTLNDPKKVDALIARLHPTELALLQEVRRYGGVVGGWTLFVFARLRGLNPPSQSMGVSSSYLFQGFSPAQFTGASLIWSLLADGLLFPAAVPNPWLTHNEFFYHRNRFELFPNAPANLLIADPRLLARLPAATGQPAPALPSEPTQTPAPSVGLLHNSRLYMSEVLRVVEKHGGIAITKSREASKTGIKRVVKDLTALHEPEMWLGIAMGLGLLVPNAQGDYIVPYRAGWQNMNSLDVRVFAGLLLNVLPTLDTPEDEEYDLLNPYTLRACLIELLRELTGPVRESVFKAQAEAVIPSELCASAYRQMFIRLTEVAQNRDQYRDQKWDAWFKATLRGVLSDFGLLTVQEGTGKNADALLIPSPVLRSEFEPEPLASGPAWILQPNFELLVYTAKLQPSHLALLSAAQAVRFDDQTATYRLTRDSVYSALEHGLDLSDLLSGLEGASATPLGPAMRRTIQDWAARRERLVMHQNATLLEFPSAAERDAALNEGGNGAVALGETFLLLAKGQSVPRGITLLKYDGPPSEPLSFEDSGELSLGGPLDMIGRALLAGRVTGAGEGLYRFMPPSSGQTYPRNLLVDLEARSSQRLPELLRFQLSVWAGLTPSPTVANLTIVQHPQAHTLAKHPALQAMLGPSLSPTLLTVQAGQESAFSAALIELGLTPKPEVMLADSATEELVVLSDTRQKRSFIEAAMRNGHNLLVHYHEEEEDYSHWYGNRKKQGKLRKQILRPKEISRSSSTPYLRAQVLEGGEHVKIRLSYILGMAIR